MTQSRNLKFDYLVASQAQKHLTVNDALARIDAMTQLCVYPNSGSVSDGQVQLAENGVDLQIGCNGGFQILKAEHGWRAYFLEDQSERIFDGENWSSKSESVLQVQRFQIDFAQNAQILIPDKSVVFGVTGRVVEDLQGEGLTAWQLGVDGDLTRYGSGIWKGKNGWVKGLTGTPITYWADTALRFTGEGGAIASGKLEIYLYILELALPPEV